MSYVNAPSGAAYAPVAINSVWPGAQNQQQPQQSQSLINPDGSVNVAALMQMFASRGSPGAASQQTAAGASSNSNPIYGAARNLGSAAGSALNGLGSTLGSAYTAATGSLGTGSSLGDLIASYGL